MGGMELTEALSVYSIATVGDGLVGQIGVYTGWMDDIASGAKAAVTMWDWTGLLCISFLLPAVITYVIGIGFRKTGWIQENDLKLDL
jgi:hypothetical protein